MAIEVKHRRGTTAQHATFTGAVGELTVDTDKDTLVVHDGVTVGGYPLLKEDLSNAPNISAFSKTILDDVSASAVLSTLGVSNFVKTILDDPTQADVLNTLGVSAYIQTLLVAASDSAARAILGITNIPGMISDFAMSTPPTGWLECNGAAISRTTYADLFSAIGTTWGVGDGSTTFNLPDFRGTVRRSWDHGRGLDTGRTFASYQADAVGNHRHGIGAGLTPGVDASAHVWARIDTFFTDYSGGAETRMKNYAVLTCIKY